MGNVIMMSGTSLTCHCDIGASLQEVSAASNKQGCCNGFKQTYSTQNSSMKPQKETSPLVI
jgi:hypothetical protein